MSEDFDQQVVGVGALAEPARRALYRYVVGQDDAVSRDQAADALGLPRHRVKFHLDRLAEVGLLDVEHRRLTERSGPGAGRPAKLYRRAARQVEVTLPERRYDLVGGVLADAVDRASSEGEPLEEAVRASARAEGRRIAATSLEDDAAGSPEAEPLGRVARVLADYGYEPRPEPGPGQGPEDVGASTVRLANCPFHRLAAQHTDLVCGLNLGLIQGVIEGLGEPTTAVLAPRPGACCVELRSGS